MRRIKRGDIVYDIADQRHRGIVRSVHLKDGQFFANVQWLESGFRSCRLPLADLRHVPDEAPDRTECSVMRDEMEGFDAAMEADEAAD